MRSETPKRHLAQHISDSGLGIIQRFVADDMHVHSSTAMNWATESFHASRRVRLRSAERDARFLRPASAATKCRRAPSALNPIFMRSVTRPPCTPGLQFDPVTSHNNRLRILSHQPVASNASLLARPALPRRLFYLCRGFLPPCPSHGSFADTPSRRRKSERGPNVAQQGQPSASLQQPQLRAPVCRARHSPCKSEWPARIWLRGRDLLAAAVHSCGLLPAFARHLVERPPSPSSTACLPVYSW